MPLKGNPSLMSEFRSGIGSLQWLAGTTRPDIAADVSLLQKGLEDLTSDDLNEINKVIKYVKATADSGICIRPVDPMDLILIAYGDSGFGNAPNNKSQGGLVIVATTSDALRTSTPCSVLEWKSYRHQRMLRSTLAAEAASLEHVGRDDGLQLHCSWLREITDSSLPGDGRKVFV